MEDTLLKRTLRSITSRDQRPLKSMALLAETGRLTPQHQAIIAEHYGLAPSFAVLGVLRELAAELGNAPVKAEKKAPRQRPVHRCLYI